jgi:hypothetical protein
MEYLLKMLLLPDIKVCIICGADSKKCNVVIRDILLYFLMTFMLLYIVRLMVL